MNASRRAFGLWLTGLPVASFAGTSTPTRSGLRRIGYLDPVGEQFPEGILAALNRLGWFIGKNLHVEGRYAMGKPNLAFIHAGELLKANVDLIVTNGPGATKAAQKSTTSVPIVFLAGDAVSLGLVGSFAHPGGNATGLSMSTPGLISKVLLLLKESKPDLRHVSMFSIRPEPLVHSSFEASCRSIGIGWSYIAIDRDPAAGAIDAGIAEMARGPAQALLLAPDELSTRHSSEIISAATKAGIVTISFGVPYDGAFACYAMSVDEFNARMAYFIDRILRGTKPADLPVEEATEYDLTLNLRTAQTLRISVPRTLLLQATIQ